MKQVLQGFWKFFEAMGQARAASVLARQGRIIEAKALYLK
jgi:hypothetical protein